MNMMKQIIQEQYKPLEIIGEGGISIVYKALDEKTGREVALKRLNQQKTSKRIEDIIRFHSEGHIVSTLSHPNIIKIYNLGEWKGLYYIVMEYIEGQSLSSIINKQRDMKIEEIVKVITYICKALDFIHGNNIIHRDLKPGNILIPFENEIPDYKNLKLIDFGLAQVKDFSGLMDAVEVAGTLSYMPPEQLGVIKRNTDERSDLYSLGIIFYQMLTMQLPFKGNSVSSIIHQHIAKHPDAPGKLNKDIPETLEKIILKLMEKDPDNRYQSANGLLADLGKFEKAPQGIFPLGLDDRSIKLDYRTSLIGREHEFTMLKDLYEKAVNNRGGICLVSGEAGRGKSRLVEELRDYVFAQGGLFIYGNCFSGKSKVPYMPFRDALNIYIKNFNKYPPGKQEFIKNEIRASLGDLGEIILLLNPMMQKIIGQSIPSSGTGSSISLPDAERETKRFLLVASHFFKNLGNFENGIVIFLDDLQWADDGTINLLYEMSHNISEYPVLFVGTYRDNEVTGEHSLNRFILEARGKGESLFEIKLDLFSNDKMRKFISGLLHDSEENIEKISDLILNKSKGNPFFSIEILKQLVNGEALNQNEYRVSAGNRWSINPEKLSRIEISSSIIEILIRRISLLGKKEMQLLTYASVIGRKFSIEFLFNLCRGNPRLMLSEKEVVDIVDRAIQLQLLEEDMQEKGTILFVHDRIKEAFYSNIDEEEKRTLHRQIAETIEKYYSDNIDNRIFDLAYHYIEAGIGEKILTYAYPSGMKAMENYANEDAIKYFKITNSILEEQGRKGGELWLDCSRNIGNIYITIGRNDEAIEIYKENLNYLKRNIEKAEAYCRICKAYFQKADFEKCEEYGRSGLELLGDKLANKRIFVILSLVKELIIHFFHSLLPGSYTASKNQSKSAKYKLIIFMYITLDWVYILTDVLKFVKLSVRMLNISISKLGKSKELGVSLAGYASVLMSIPLKRSLKLHKRSLALRYEFNDKWGIGQSLQFIGFNYQWKGDYNNAIKYFEKCMEIFKSIYDIWECEMTSHAIFNHYHYIADYDKAKSVLDSYSEMSGVTKNNYSIGLSLINNMQIDIEKGDYNRVIKNSESCYEKTKSNEILYLNCMCCIELARLYILVNDIKKAVKYIEEAQSLYENNNFLKHYTGHIYCYLVEAYICNYLSVYNDSSAPGDSGSINTLLPVEDKKSYLKRIKYYCKKAIKETKDWHTHYGASLRVNAKYYALIGKAKKAEELFLQSIEELSALGRKYEQAVSLYEFSLFLEKCGKMEASRRRLESANRIFKEINSRAFHMKTSQLLGAREKEVTVQERLMDKERLASIIKLSQDISSILNLDELLENILSKAIQVTGAYRGYLFIYDEDKGALELKVMNNIIDAEKDKFSSYIVDSVFKKAAPVIINDAQTDENLTAHLSIVEYGLKSVLCAPIRHHKKILGVCYLDNPLSRGVFVEEDAEMLGVFTNQAAIAIENAYLYNNLERKVLERTGELNEAYKKLKKTLNDSSLLVSDVGHKFYNELWPFAEMVLLVKDMVKNIKSGDINIDKERLVFIEENVVECEKSLNRIEDMKDKIKKNFGKDAERVNNKINFIITDLLGEFKNKLNKLNIVLNTYLNFERDAELKVNAEQIIIALENLLNNSIQALLKTRKEHREITFSAGSSDGFFIITIEDNGPGIPDDLREKIFRMFYSTKKNDENKSLGLGLYLTRWIIEDCHRGRLEVESEIDRYTRFKIYLPEEG